MHGSHAHSDDTNADHDPAHPDMWAQLAHDEVAWKVEDDIADIEQCEAGRHLLGGQVQDFFEGVSLGLIHRLCQADIRFDCAADEIEYPESRDDSTIELPDYC